MRPQKRAGPLRSPARRLAGRPARRAAADAATEKLQKVLAQAGIGSRRAMEEWIREGRVTVNGVIATIGARVSAADDIRVEGRALRRSSARKLARVLIYHKPEGEIVTRDDPQGRTSVFDRLPPLRGGKWLAVGRLDFNTTGLLLFTDSGALANQLMHPRYEIEREYAVRILGKLTADQQSLLQRGVELDDGVAKCMWVEEEGGEGANHWYRIAVREGRNRLVRRLFEALHLTVSRLTRVRLGPVALPPRLRRGQLIEMAPAEVRRLSEWLARPVADRAPALHG